MSSRRTIKTTNWGRYPKISACQFYLDSPFNIELNPNDFINKFFIARGMGRSYGDSALGTVIIETTKLNKLISFDAKTGVLETEAGVSLDTILQLFVPKGWFLPVTPGTKFVSVGGAIASDVHGKNHHSEGTFCDHVLSANMWTPQKGFIEISPKKNSDIFHATCGGMGLTGIIISAKIQLKPIETSYIHQTAYKAKNIDHILDLFEQTNAATYSVAWIDCLAKGKNLGRSLLMVGEHANQGQLLGSKLMDSKFLLHRQPKLTIPFSLPQLVLNKWSIKAFNMLYYNKMIKKQMDNIVHYEPFFYPLDGIGHWNRMYGRRGFTQYQFVIPQKYSREGIKEILERITRSGKGSFLAVLKQFGKANKNTLSFPTEGLTLALDFAMSKKTLKLLDELDELVAKYNGRLYLTKDARMSAEFFQSSYTNLKQFQKIKKQLDPHGLLQSLQSQRLGI